MRLVIEAEALNGRWSLTDAWQRGRASWPPSPDTLFSALVAASAEAGWGEASSPADVTRSRFGRALCWLEAQGLPEIDAVLEPGMVQGRTWYVPTGDHAGLDQLRERKARHHNSIGCETPVRWAWAVDPGEAQRQLPVLQQIVGEVARIGSSRGPCLAAVKLIPPASWRPALVPSAGGTWSLRSIYPGRLDDLERWFQAGERPRPGPVQAYARPEAVPVAPAWGEIVVLRRCEGPPLGIERAVEIAEAARNALLAHLGDAAPEVLSGHAVPGAPSRQDHLAIVPMARVGDPYADGRMFGLGFVVPHRLPDPVWFQLMAALGRWIGGGGRLAIGRSLAWRLEFATGDLRASLDPARYRRPAHRWSSVTPVVFDRHPKPGAGRTLPDIVAAMCRASRLPPPTSIEATMQPSFQGGAESRRHRLGNRAYLQGRYIAHLRLAWDRPVPGPILLGSGRHFGLGLMLPDRDAAASPRTLRPAA